MDPIACFNKWAGEHEWSDWVKPTLFAQAGMGTLTPDRANGEALLAKADQIIQATAARTLSAGAGEAQLPWGVAPQALPQPARAHRGTGTCETSSSMRVTAWCRVRAPPRAPDTMMRCASTGGAKVFTSSGIT